MSTEFTIDFSDSSKNFIIGIKFSNGLVIDFESDLNNISAYEIRKFMDRFKKKKKCCLDILNSKKNTVEISYEPKESKISFNTWNEGYMFADVECNYNQTKIEFQINATEHDKFYSVLDEMYVYMLEESESDSDEESDDCYDNGSENCIWQRVEL